MFSEYALIVDIVERMQPLYLFWNKLIFGHEVIDIEVDGLDEDAKIHQLGLDLFDLVDKSYHHSLFLSKQLELYQCYPKE